MTTEDVNQLLAIMKANYSYAFKTMSQEEKYMLLCTWTVTLQDLPTDIVMMAVMQLVSKSKWLPTVAEIRAACREMHYAAATPDTVFDMMVAAGMPVTPEQQREHERLEAKRIHRRGNKTPAQRGYRWVDGKPSAGESGTRGNRNGAAELPAAMR